MVGILALGIFYFFFAKQWISLSLRDKTFNEYTTRMVQAAASQYRPARDVRTLVMVKADELSLPINSDQIEVHGMGRTLYVDVRYEDDITLPLLNRPFYRMRFEHTFASGMLQ